MRFFARLNYYVRQPDPDRSLLDRTFSIVVLAGVAYGFYLLDELRPNVFILGTYIIGAIAFLQLAVLIFFPLWFFASTVRRARNRARLRTQEWPPVLLTPGFDSFPVEAWSWLPHYQEFLTTPYSSAAGDLPEVQLYAALVLADELIKEGPLGENQTDFALERLYDHRQTTHS